MPRYIALMRIRRGGKLTLPGEPIELSKDEKNELPTGAVSEGVSEEFIETTAAAAVKLFDVLTSIATPDTPLSDDQKLIHDAAVKAVGELPEEAFKKDGGIRADALRDLNDALGFEVSAEDVAALRPTQDA